VHASLNNFERGGERSNPMFAMMTPLLQLLDVGLYVVSAMLFVGAIAGWAMQISEAWHRFEVVTESRFP